MRHTASLAVVICSGLFLLALGLACLFRPPRARNFLLAFATTAAKHYAELFVRFTVGGAFVLAAPNMAFPIVFSTFGCVLIITTAALACVPWRFHRAFAARVVPVATSFMVSLGLASTAAALVILAAVSRGAA